MAELIRKKSTSTSTSSSTTDPSLSKPKSTCFDLACFGFSRKVSTSSSRPRPPRTRRSSSKSSPSSLIKKETNYIPSQHHHHHHHQDHEDRKIIGIKSSNGGGTSRRWYLISWSSWRSRTNNSATKTVPIDTSGTVTDKRARQSNTLKKTKSKSTTKSGKLVSDSKREIPATNDGEPPPAGSPSQREAVAVLPAPESDLQTPLTQKPTETNTINLENKRHLECSKDGTCQKRLSFCRKRGASSSNIRSQPGSPVQEETKPKCSSRTAMAVISHSASFPTQIRQSRRAENPVAAHKHNTVSNKATLKTNKSAETIIMSNKMKNSSSSSLDPVVGMTIIMVTLIIMLFWGRLCAILCTSAWLYFLPRLRSSSSAAAATSTGTHHDRSAAHHSSSIYSSININNSTNPRDLDLSSEEYKKKLVVLEGFLERNNHRNN